MAAHASWQVGSASVVITPDEPMWMAGYAARAEPSRGTISDLRARAVAIQDSARKDPPLVIVSVDLIAVQDWLIDAVAPDITRRFGVPRERMLFAATHTHFGPEIRADKEYFFKIPPEWGAKIPAYLEILQRKLIDVISRALQAMAPATLHLARAQAGFAHNRRPHGDIHDHDVPVLSARDAATNAVRAVIFGYACHNTTIDPQDRRFCGDWAGFAAEQIERENPGAAALFITGAAADQNPDPRGTVELSRKYGQELAEAVKTALDAKGQDLHPPVKIAWGVRPLAFMVRPRGEIEKDLSLNDPPAVRKAQYLLRQLDEKGALPADHPYAVQAIDFGGSLLLIAMPCETVVDWSHKLKKLYQDGPGSPVWVAGYCNDMLGYVPTHRVQQEGGYEGGRATLWNWTPGPFTEDLETRVTHAVTDAVAQLRKK
jgi:hypothetical protein